MRTAIRIKLKNSLLKKIEEFHSIHKENLNENSHDSLELCEKEPFVLEAKKPLRSSQSKK